MKNFIQPGEALELTAPAGGVVAGKAYAIGVLIVVAQAAAAVGVKFIGSTGGVYELSKTAAQAYTEGQQLYLIVATSVVTSTAGANLPCGVAVVAALAADTTAKVLLSSSIQGA